MDVLLPVVALLGVLFLVGRGVPASRWPLILVGTLAVVVVVILVERAGLWPQSFRVR